MCPLPLSLCRWFYVAQVYKNANAEKRRIMSRERAFLSERREDEMLQMTKSYQRGCSSKC